MYKDAMSRRLIWNSNELVFENNTSVGVAGIASHMPDVFGEELANRWNAAIPQDNTEEKQNGLTTGDKSEPEDICADCITESCDSRGLEVTECTGRVTG